MASIELDTVVARGSEHVETQMGDQTVMMSLEQSRYFALEDSGQRIWELMAEPVRVGDIVDRLVEEYEVARDECAADVLAFLRDLDRHGLVARDAA